MNSYVDFLDNILPQIELAGSNFDKIYELVEELVNFKFEFNANSLDQDSIILSNTSLSLKAELSPQLLWSKKIIIEDPFDRLHKYYNYIKGDYAFGRTSYWSAEDTFVSHITRVVDNIFKLTDFFHDGSIAICRMTDLASQAEVLPISEQQFIEMIEIDAARELPHDMVGFNFLGHSFSVEYSRSDAFEYYESMKDAISANWYGRFLLPEMKGLIATQTLSSLSGGIYSASHGWHWTLAKALQVKQHNRASIREFSREVVLPDAFSIDTDMLKSMRANEEIFFKLRQAISQSARLVKAAPGSSGFDRESQDIFRDIFETQFALFDRDIRKSPTLSSLSIAGALIGCAVAPQLAGEAGPVSTAAAIAGLAIGSGEIINAVRKKRKYQDDAIFALWELRSPLARKSQT
jgi:hypothetical protein